MPSRPERIAGGWLEDHERVSSERWEQTGPNGGMPCADRLDPSEGNGEPLKHLYPGRRHILEVY